MSAPSSTKKTSIDRFSALPDCLLIHILGFLEMKEASITSLLSKRWQFLWTRLTRLAFREDIRPINYTRKLVARVNRTLMIYCRNNVESLEVEFGYNEEFACDVNAWIEFAVRIKVKVFHLVLNSISRDLHTLPQMMFTNSSLTSLYVRGSVLAPRKTIEWHSLTELRIQVTLLSQIVVEKILSGCPVLRSLDIVRCLGFNCLDIKSPSLHRLRVSDNETSLEISAPYVRYLEIDHPGERKLCLRNVQSVVRANIGLSFSQWNPISEEMKSNAKELLVKTLHVKELEVQSSVFEVMSQLVVNGWQLPQSTRESLKVFVYTDNEHMHITSGFLALLKSSPKIDTLTIYLDIDATDKVLVTSGPSARDDLDCDLLHLKAVKYIYYAEPSNLRYPMLTWARILLKRATILEEMVIETLLADDTSDFVKISRILHNYPRSSQKAVVLLSSSYYKHFLL